MKDNAALLSAVARLLNYLRNRDLPDEIQTAGAGFDPAADSTAIYRGKDWASARVFE